MNVHESSTLINEPRAHVHSNPRGQGARVPWLFVLPSANIGRAYCWGQPAKSVWQALSGMAKKVQILDDSALKDSRDELPLNAEGVECSCRSSVTLDRTSGDALHTLQSLDLLYIAKPLPRDRQRRQRLEQWMANVLNRGGAVYCDGDLRDALPGSPSAEVRQLLRIGSHAQGLYVAPSHETMLCQQFDATRRNVDWLSYLRRIWSQLKHFGTVWQRQSVPSLGTLWCRQEQQNPGPPQFLQGIAQANGIALANYRWGFLANGSYPSRKLLFYLIHPVTQEREFLVKMTQADAFNSRLQREERALEALARVSLPEEVTTPQVCFSGEHAGRWILAESYLEGRPFDQADSIAIDSAPVRSLLHWLAELGRQTASSPDADSDHSWHALQTAFRSYLDLYQPPREERQYLTDQMNRLESMASHMPRVLTHGDLGRWNLMLHPSGRLVILDWESYEPQGMPAWDLFYFLRSQLVGASRRRGKWDRIQSLQDGFLTPGSAQTAILNAASEYFSRVSVPAECFEPLFITCWMHRAVKEATRLRREQLPSAHYARWLRTVIVHRKPLEIMAQQLTRPLAEIHPPAHLP